MAVFLLTLILFSVFLSILFFSIISFGKGGVYPAKRVIKKRIQMSAMGAALFLLAIIIMWKF